MIRKTKAGYVLYSRKKTKGKRRRLGGPYKTKAALHRRIRQVEWHRAHG